MVEAKGGEHYADQEQVIGPEPPPNAEELARVQQMLFAQLIGAHPEVGLLDQEIFVHLPIEGRFFGDFADKLTHAHLSKLFNTVLAFQVRTEACTVVEASKHFYYLNDR